MGARVCISSIHMKIQMWQHVPVTPVLGEWKQENRRSFLAIWLGQIDELQVWWQILCQEVKWEVTE